MGGGLCQAREASLVALMNNMSGTCAAKPGVRLVESMERLAASGADRWVADR